jgi:hypothetical protein
LDEEEAVKTRVDTKYKKYFRILQNFCKISQTIFTKFDKKFNKIFRNKRKLYEKIELKNVT